MKVSFCATYGSFDKYYNDYYKKEKTHTMNDLKSSLITGVAVSAITAAAMTANKKEKVLLNSVELGSTVACFSYLAQLLTDKFYNK